MILIYAAAEMQPRILEEAPSFFGKHLNYLKDRYPLFFSHREALDSTKSGESSNDSDLISEVQSKHLARFEQFFQGGEVFQLLNMTRNSYKQLTRNTIGNAETSNKT